MMKARTRAANALDVYKGFTPSGGVTEQGVLF